MEPDVNIFLLAARLVLALIFGVAGIAKALDKTGSHKALIGFGVPERLAVPLGSALPFIEIVVAFLLIPLGTAWLGSIAALALLLVFSAGMSVSLVRGQSPDCRCFGQLHSEPISWLTVSRNLLLAAVAGFVVVKGNGNTGLSAVSWVNTLRTAELIDLVLGVSTTALLAIICFALLKMLKQQSKLLSGIEGIKAALGEDSEPANAGYKEAVLPTEGLPIGARAPRFALPTIADRRISLDGLLEDGKSVLLIFAGPNCWGCNLLLPMVRAWERDYADRLTIAVLSNGTLKDNQKKMARYEIGLLLVDEDSTVSDEYQAKWTPAAVLIRPDGKIATQNIYGDNAIREAVRGLIASDQLGGPTNGRVLDGLVPQVAVRHSARKIGEPAPRFSLPDLSGKLVDGEDFLGNPALLIFWHPRCEFCLGMLDDLRHWEETASSDSPRLVFIASGEVDDTKALNTAFNSTTLLDPSFEIGPVFGTKFTPSAILIDAEGRISSGLAIGDHNVRALVGLGKAETQLTAQVTTQV